MTESERQDQAAAVRLSNRLNLAVGFVLGAALTMAMIVIWTLATMPDPGKDAHGVPCTISEECQ